MCKRDREHTAAELSAENARFSRENLLRAAYEEGVELGRREVRLEFASKMLEAGMSVDFIKQVTSLTDEEIAALRN